MMFWGQFHLQNVMLYLLLTFFLFFFVIFGARTMHKANDLKCGLKSSALFNP